MRQKKLKATKRNKIAKKKGKWGGYRSKIKDKEKRSRRRVAEQNKKEEDKRRSRGRVGLANERSPYANDGTRVKT